MNKFAITTNGNAHHKISKKKKKKGKANPVTGRGGP
jgi:hypothetical protein